MYACKHIFSNMHGHNFANAVAYLYVQVTKICPNVQIKNEKKRRLSKMSTKRRWGKSCGCGLWKSYRYDGGDGRVIGVWCGRGHCGDPDNPYNTCNNFDIRDIYQDFSSADLYYIQVYGWAYFRFQRIRAKAGGRHCNDGAFGGVAMAEDGRSQKLVLIGMTPAM